jgi:hypothetical protein
MRSRIFSLRSGSRIPVYVAIANPTVESKEDQALHSRQASHYLIVCIFGRIRREILECQSSRQGLLRPSLVSPFGRALSPPDFLIVG